MTTPRDDYVSKSSYKNGLTILSILLATICVLLTVVFTAAYAASNKTTELEIKYEKHVTQAESLQNILGEIKVIQKEQCSKLEEQGHILILQGQKLDEVNRKITEHCSAVGSMPK